MSLNLFSNEKEHGYYTLVGSQEMTFGAEAAGSLIFKVWLQNVYHPRVNHIQLWGYKAIL